MSILAPVLFSKATEYDSLITPLFITNLAPLFDVPAALSTLIPPQPFPDVSISVTVTSDALFTRPYPVPSFIVTLLSSTSVVSCPAPV